MDHFARPRCLAAGLMAAFLVHVTYAQTDTIDTGHAAQSAVSAAARPQPPRRIPIHAGPAGAGAYGIWAAGPGYKVSFHDGFAFYPVLGAASPDNLPLRWHTEAITAGTRRLIDADAAPVHVHSAFRYEYRWPGVTEAYDVREDGVEQTFVVHAPPASPGDLVVVGRLETRLRPQAAVAAAHGPVVFADDAGAPRVSYGAAFVVDASGRRAPITTACDGARVRLTVPQAWLAGAVYPVTIDPLTAPVSLNQAEFRSVSIDRENESASRNVMVTYSIRSSQSDLDVFALLYSDTFNDGVLVFADFSASWSSFVTDAAFAGGADRWVVAYTTLTGSVPPRGRLYFHARGNLGLNTGTQATLLGFSAAERHSSLTLGGSESGNQVLLVYELATGAVGSPGQLWGAVVAADAGSIGWRTRISPVGQSLDGAARIDVSRDNSAADPGWLVAYAALTGQFPTLRRDVFVTRVESATLGQVAPVRIATGGDPHVDGRNGRFLVTSTDGPFPFAWNLLTHRVDWPRGATGPAVVASRVLGANLFVLGLAHDHVTQSHWCALVLDAAAPNVRALRLGFSGALIESALVGAPPARAPDRSEGVTFSPFTREFLLAYLAPAASGTLLQARRLQYPADAVNAIYGRGCNDAGLAISASRPYAGSEFFQVNLRSGSRLTPPLPNGTPCVLMLSLAPASRSFNGCTTLVSLAARDHIVNLPATMMLGMASVRYPLLDAPLFQRDLFGQWMWGPPRGSLTPNGMSAGLRMQVR